ncbi:hypothetical protein CDD80_810 [Ophiocordyceps camponoti-rufipedis]|uniref:Peptidyl-prolyl cis-trans isomerase-like 2 n=1 Tax=Ophiocordyceps camponoti-rufipedis TaxID=2004952 RepID=A0A2C5ZCN9_9HYPO|nr:hypothetical protein CDD80_810 [Ophiocordyceps camponoti-rufipedis]
MGKGTDKLYITHSEWSSSDAYSASVGAGASSRGIKGSYGAPFRRLPFNYCAASLQPFKNPVCTPDGTVFDVEVIDDWLKEHPNQNPVDGKPLYKKDLIKLNFAKNSESDALAVGLGKSGLVDHVTYKVFTDNTHIVAIRHGTYANVFAWETVERMNIKAKLWQDLVDDEPFTRDDIITLQDPRSSAGRDLDEFKYLKDGQTAQMTKQQQEAREASNINTDALGSIGDKFSKAKAAVEKTRKAREAGADVNRSAGTLIKPPASASTVQAHTMIQQKKTAPNAATYTTGRAAASFTSTGLTPETSGERALLSDEEFMLKPRRVKTKGYAKVMTNLGDLTLELQTETAPKAVWNFIRLAQKGYYDGVAFHRNMANFMIQGGDPSGTGKGGSSIWGKYFDDEFDGPLTHNARGIVSMANKGKNTNSSQFFITYQPASHLDRKHTIFGRVQSGSDVLAQMEAVPTDGSDRPLRKILIKSIAVLIDPFEEFQAQRREELRQQQEREEIRLRGGTDDDKTTWTGKRIRGHGADGGEASKLGVGRYLKAADVGSGDGDAMVETWEEPVKKKSKRGGGGGFGNFDNW